MAWEAPGYRAEELIGVGGSGDVWRARRIDTGELVALKRIAIDDPALLRAARAEAALLAAFDHPHILRLHELLVLDRDAILVLDYAEGGSLADVLEHRGRLAPGEVVTFLAPIAAALAHAHAEGVIHGDISPGNILFSADGLPLLADLGTARLTGQAETAVSATPGYIDSVVAGGGPLGPHSDVFSLAAVAWRALAGRPVWDGSTPLESLSLAATSQPATIGSVAPRTPPNLAAVIDRAMQGAGHLRGSAAELALDSRHAVQPVPIDGWTGRRAALRPDPPSGEAGAAASGQAGAAASGGPHVPRHAAREDADADVGPGPEPLGGRPGERAPGGRPEFRRPRRHDDGVRSTDRTRAVPAKRAAPEEAAQDDGAVAAIHGARRRIALGAAAAVLALAGVLGGVGWWAARGAARAETPPAVPAAAPSDPLPATPQAGASAGPTAPPPAAEPPTAPQQGPADDRFDWIAQLAALDSVRQQAYAQRRSDLLIGVYRPGPLLDEDAAQLEALVPAGCGLVGAASSYRLQTAGPIQPAEPAEPISPQPSQPSQAASQPVGPSGSVGWGSRVALTVTGRIAGGRVVCGGVQIGQTDPLADTELEIVLVSGSDGQWRIDEQRRV